MVNPANVGKRLITHQVDDGVWSVRVTPSGLVYSYHDCDVPSWLVQALEYGPKSDVVRKRWLGHNKRFTFVYAALDYGVSPGTLQDWIVDGPWQQSMKDDMHALIGKYLRQSVRLTRFREKRRCYPFADETEVMPMMRNEPIRSRARMPVWEDDNFDPEDLVALDRVERAIRMRPAIEAEIAADAATRRAPEPRGLAGFLANYRIEAPRFDDEPQFVDALTRVMLPHNTEPAPYSSASDEEDVPIKRTFVRPPDVILARDVVRPREDEDKRVKYDGKRPKLSYERYKPTWMSNRPRMSAPPPSILGTRTGSDLEDVFIHERGDTRPKYQDKRPRLE